MFLKLSILKGLRRNNSMHTSFAQFKREIKKKKKREFCNMRKKIIAYISYKNNIMMHLFMISKIAFYFSYASLDREAEVVSAVQIILM